MTSLAQYFFRALMRAVCPIARPRSCRDKISSAYPAAALTSRGSWRYPSTPCSITSGTPPTFEATRSEEHTSELQSQSNLVCRLLLEKKKKKKDNYYSQNKNKRKTYK